MLRDANPELKSVGGAMAACLSAAEGSGHAKELSFMNWASAPGFARRETRNFVRALCSIIMDKV